MLWVMQRKCHLHHQWIPLLHCWMMFLASFGIFVPLSKAVLILWIHVLRDLRTIWSLFVVALILRLILRVYPVSSFLALYAFCFFVFQTSWLWLFRLWYIFSTVICYGTLLYFLQGLGTFNVNGFFFLLLPCYGTSLFLMFPKGEKSLRWKVRGFLFRNIFWTYFFNYAIIEILRGSERHK